MADDSLDDIERRGFAYIEQKQWESARQCFEKMLGRPMPTKREVKVLQNILRTYQRQDRMEEAITTGERTLELIEGSDFGQTMEGTFAHGQVLGLVKEMRRDRVRGAQGGHLESTGSSWLLRLLGVAVLGSILYFVFTKWPR
jgi:hypothetical protein